MSDIIDLGSIQDSFGWSWPWQKQRRPGFGGTENAHYQHVLALLVDYERERQAGVAEMQRSGCSGRMLEYFGRLVSIGSALETEKRYLSRNRPAAIFTKIQIAVAGAARVGRWIQANCMGARAPGA